MFVLCWNRSHASSAATYPARGNFDTLSKIKKTEAVFINILSGDKHELPKAAHLRGGCAHPATSAGPGFDQGERDSFPAPSSQCPDFPEILIRLHDNAPGHTAPTATVPLALPLGWSCPLLLLILFILL
ncbi:hypothetical protein EVAR_51585_1 [Eumeta japonica]|uniref:Uncharacterized protein n=1 Tax=Eumeta variegata TaxID=151549 RepID=A0A4C1YHY1_EUMVA|nr:hypothetical protein EVAR_51585_1 [Eumeta japonica]